MSTYRLEKLFCLRSVAIVGASPRERSLGRSIARNLRAGGFGGSLHIVNPNYEYIDGLSTLNSVEAIAEVLDIVVISAPQAAVPEIVAAAGAKGAAAAIIITAGLSHGTDSFTGFTFLKSTVKSAPSFRDTASRSSTESTTIMVVAPLSHAPAVAQSPMGPLGKNDLYEVEQPIVRKHPVDQDLRLDAALVLLLAALPFGEMALNFPLLARAPLSRALRSGKCATNATASHLLRWYLSIEFALLNVMAWHSTGKLVTGSAFILMIGPTPGPGRGMLTVARDNLRTLASIVGSLPSMLRQTRSMNASKVSTSTKAALTPARFASSMSCETAGNTGAPFMPVQNRPCGKGFGVDKAEHSKSMTLSSRPL
jgi:predicted CoA-binding protein